MVIPTGQLKKASTSPPAHLPPPSTLPSLGFTSRSPPAATAAGTDAGSSHGDREKEREKQYETIKRDRQWEREKVCG